MLWVKKVKVTQSCPTLCNTMDCPWNSPGQSTGVGSLSLLQGIFQTQGSNPGLPHCRQILYQLSHKGSPRILEWVAYTFSSVYLPNPGTKPGSPALQADSLPAELSGKPKITSAWTGTWTLDPQAKSLMLYWLSYLGSYTLGEIPKKQSNWFIFNVF